MNLIGIKIDWNSGLHSFEDPYQHLKQQDKLREAEIYNFELNCQLQFWMPRRRCHEESVPANPPLTTNKIIVAITVKI